MAKKRAATLGELRATGYEVLPVREEMRKNLIARLRNDDELFPGIVGFEQTVIPQLENAILSGQDVMLLGERGQAKSRIIRSLTSLLDEWTPVIEGAEIPENPFAPISAQGKQIVEDQGEDTPIRWMHRDERFGEKLATPDITIADLIGENRSDQGGGGSLPLRRAHHPLRAGPAHQPRHLRHQRAARPRRAHPGGAAQRHGGA